MASSTQPMKISGDPRRPNEVEKWRSPKKPEEVPADFRIVGAMMLGLASMLLKVSWFGWGGVFLLLQYTATFQWRDFDLKSMMSATFFTLSGLVGSYINPQGGGGVLVQSIKNLFGGGK